MAGRLDNKLDAHNRTAVDFTSYWFDRERAFVYIGTV